jgi:hypothetical protein
VLLRTLFCAASVTTIVAVSCGGLTDSDGGGEAQKDSDAFDTPKKDGGEAADSGSRAPGTGSGPYTFCRWEGASGYEKYCAPTTTGWGYDKWHVDENAEQLFGGRFRCREWERR